MVDTALAKKASMWLAACGLGALAACAVDDRAVSVAVSGNEGDGTAGSDAGGSDAGGSDASGSGAGGVASSGGPLGGGAGGAPGSGASNGGASNGGASNDASSNGGASNGGTANGGAPPVGGSGGLNAGAGGGGCTGAQCAPPPAVDCAVDTVSSVPFTTAWSSVGKPNLYNGSCDNLGTPDYALVFIAPQAGMYRIRATAFVDSVPYTGPDPSAAPTNPADGDAVMTVAFDGCAGSDAPQVDCSDDFSFETLDSQSNLDLDAGDVVTVYLNELSQTGGGTGTVSIELRP